MGAGLVVVGPCAAGKTTLVRELAAQGIPARAVAQEHSRIDELFRHRPYQGLVYLTAEWPTIHARRPWSFGRPQYEAELGRLQRARAAADLVIHTDGLTPAEVCRRVATWWRGRAD